MSDAGDRPSRSRPTDRESAPGGWDDGRGRRPRNARNRSGRNRQSRNETEGRPPTGRRVPRWIPIAGVAVLLLLIVVIVVASGDDKKAADAGSCLSELATHLPEKATTVYGTDLVQARSAGYDDSGALEDLGSSQQATGAIPDPLTGQIRFGRLVSVEDFTGQTGVAPGDIRCALSNVDTAVLSGSFDAAEVRGSALGAEDRIVASSDVLVVGDGLTAPTTGAKAPRKLLEEQDPNLADADDVTTVLSSLRNQGAYSLILQRGAGSGKIRAAGIGVGGTGDTRQVVVAWRFAGDRDAEAGKREVVERVNDVLQGIASIDATDLTVDGNLVIAAIDVRKAPDLQRLLLTRTPFIRRGT